MKHITLVAISLFMIGMSTCAQPGNLNLENYQFSNVQINGANAPAKPAKIQIVFCLDVTGSMGGLIATAKQKIWSIASTVLQTEPKPELQLGLVFYRDRGDDFVTKILPFTQDVDSLYAKLMDMAAGGGGDSPESVNKALFDAVNNFQWYEDTSVYKAVFLVGDCPPHMDYANDVKYPETCRKAVKNDIVINTLRMGNCAGAAQHWQEIATITGGDYISVDQSANGYVTTTPYDAEIARLQNTIDNTVVFYGTITTRTSKEFSKAQANKIYKEGKVNENASRAEYKTSKGIRYDTYYKHDLVTDYSNGNIRPDTIKTEMLPDTLKKMTVVQRTEYVVKMKQTRDTASAQLKSYVEKRNTYIKNKAAEDVNSSSNSFSTKVYTSMKKQTAKKGVVLKGSVKE
jgi:Mg-chelatase subunit ChlD